MVFWIHWKRIGDKPAVRQTVVTCWEENQVKENKRKQREACFLWVNLQDFQPGQKENTNSYFWPKSSWQMTQTFQFPVTLFLTLLGAIVWHWHGGEKPHTAFALGHLGSPVAARLRRALPICSHATSSAFKGGSVSEERLCTLEKKNTHSLKRLVKISEGTEPFFLFFPFSPVLLRGEFETGCWRGGWGNLFKAHITLENLRGLHHSTFKSTF